MAPGASEVIMWGIRSTSAAYAYPSYMKSSVFTYTYMGYMSTDLGGHQVYFSGAADHTSQQTCDMLWRNECVSWCVRDNLHVKALLDAFQASPATHENDRFCFHIRA